MRNALVVLLLCFCACKPSEDAHMQAIIGAVLIDGAGGPPLSNSIVLVSGSVIQAAGVHSSIPIPAEADKVDGAGKFLVPRLVDICDRPGPAALLKPATPEEARAQVAALVGKGGVIHLGMLPKPVMDAVFEAAREAHLPVIGHIAGESDARAMVDGGASSLVGMIGDTEKLDTEFVARLRDLRIVVAPSLGKAGPDLALASRNTLRLFRSGVPLAVASQGGDPVREAELLAEAGVPPLDVIVAATHNGAQALHQLEERGVIEAGRRAGLLLLSANPGEDIRNLRRVALLMQDGKWIH